MIEFDPPLLNSSNRWATTEEELSELYRCPHTGAVTIRTSSLSGFAHDDAVHQYCYFQTRSQAIEHGSRHGIGISDDTKNSSAVTNAVKISSSELPGRAGQVSSLNTIGYSPIRLEEYIDIISRIQSKEDTTTATTGASHSDDATDPHSRGGKRRKPVIFSVAGTPEELGTCHALLCDRKPPESTWMMEVNLSCPNLPGKPPPAYSKAELRECLAGIARKAPPGSASSLPPPPAPTGEEEEEEEEEMTVPIGLKLPPYTHRAQFDDLVSALRENTAGTISFLTSTNTLGNCLVMDTDGDRHHDDDDSDDDDGGGGGAPALASSDGTGIGGLAGPALHPLALGNVRTLRSMLDREREREREHGHGHGHGHRRLGDIRLIGVGGVFDRAGYRRMRAAGASAVAVGTAFGAEGVGVFEKILLSGTTRREKS